jgi:phosphoribosylamine---glycine ligase
MLRAAMMAATDRLQLLPQPALEGRIMERVILPAVAAMECWGRSFKGALRAGLILLELNVRLGDSEAQVLFMRLMSDLLPALIAARERVLKSVDLRWHAEHAVCVVMAARGCSGEPQRGTEISDLTAALEGCLAFSW